MSDMSPIARVPLEVRWRDLDALNHVNNAAYLTFLEEARLRWLKGVHGAWFSEHAMPVQAATHINYRRPITWPASIVVELACEHAGTSSLTISHRIVDAEDKACLYADGNVVLVWIDPTTGKSVPLPSSVREALAAS